MKTKCRAEAAGGELFEIELLRPYTDADLDWRDEGSQGSVEHENEDERGVELVTTDVDNWESYDTVFIGYPNIACKYRQKPSKAVMYAA